MYNFESLHLINYLLWQDIEFKFEEGITNIMGENGSGKSTLFSSLGAILHNTDNIPKNSRATLSLSTAKNTFDFTVLNQGKARNRFEVAIDGKQQKAERIDDGRRIIDKYYGANIQESIFRTTIFLNGRKDHPLAEGKPSDRLDWVHETLAYASILDAYLDRVDSKLKDAKDDNVRYGMLVEQLKSMVTVDKPSEDTDILRSRIAKITDMVKSLEKKKSAAEYALKYKETATDAPKISLKDALSNHDKYDRLMRKLTKQKELFETQQERLEKRNQVIEEWNTLKREYKQLCKRLKLPTTVHPQKMNKIAEDTLEKAEKAFEKASRNNEIYEEQADLRAFLDKHSDRKVTQTRDTLKKQQDKLEKAYHVTSLAITAHESGDEYCSLCGSDLKHGKTHNISELRQENKKRKNKIESIKIDLKVLKARSVDVVSKIIDLDELQTTIKNCKKMRNLCQSYNSLAQQKQSFSDLTDVEEIDESKLAKVQRLYKNAQKTLIAAQTQDSIKKRFSDIEGNEYVSRSRKELETLIDEFDNSIGALYKKQRRLNEELIQTETSQALYRKYRRDRKELRDRAESLSSSARDFKLLSVAKKALGRDGFRTKRLESTLELFVDNLNSLAPLVWRKPYKFEIETGPRKCDVIVHRNGQVGTAFSLSGAEQRCWQLVSALAMLRLLPDNRRCNTIILDEIDANTDAMIRQRMMSDLLPEVQKTVPNVIVVSPRSTKELFLQADRTYKVINKGSRSSLIEA